VERRKPSTVILERLQGSGGDLEGQTSVAALLSAQF
jgi:hypothetical protein